MNFSVSTSSVKKGESLLDTVQTIEAMGIDAIVVRHSAAGAPYRVASWTTAAVINAGDGRHEHPTQGLLDAFTLRRHRGPSLDGCRVAIVGDVKHSRVARSDVKAFHELGCELTLVGPPTLMPERLDGWPVSVAYDLDDVLTDVDVVYLLRIQRERIGDALFPSIREYASRWGLTVERAARLKPDTLVMHPGPMNRGIEIAGEVADSARSLVTEQVANGVAVRMAVLWSLLGSGGAFV
jgi:aspartate carbamoyltransferase catalytic subunit